MLEIPPAKDTDAEDVVWGLQTAETLWKRGERIDALVWLRRAAQAAGDANDDDRALELARHAAELTEWMARSEPVLSRPHEDVGPPNQNPNDEDLDTTPIDVEEEMPAAEPVPAPSPQRRTGTQPMMQAVSVPQPDEGEVHPPIVERLPTPPMTPIALVVHAPTEDGGRPSATSVLPAERVHAGRW